MSTFVESTSIKEGATMFAMRATKAQTKAATRSTSKPVLQLTSLVARPFDGNAIEQARLPPREIGNQATLQLLEQRARGSAESDSDGLREQELAPHIRHAPGASW